MTTSVALCTYNGARFIEEQICSIWNQTMLVDEIVVCDDGSSDETVNIVKDLSSRIQIPIRVYTNKVNLGCIRNFEKAISLCNHDVIFLSDQDDIWEKDKVETIVNWFDKHPNKDTVISDAILIDSLGNQITNETYFSLYFDEYSRSLFDGGYGLELFANRNRACGATMAIRKKRGESLSMIVHDEQLQDVYDRCVKYNIIHDYLMAIMSIADGKLGYINRVLTRYRQHGKQVCGVGKVTKIINDEAYLLDYYKEDCLIHLPLSKEAEERVNFIFWRSKLRKNIFTPINIIIQANKYRKLYSCLCLRFMKYDIIEYWKKLRNRIVQFYIRLFNTNTSTRYVFISYGDVNFIKSLKRIKKEASRLKLFDKIIVYTPKDLPRGIRKSPLMQYSRGGGYWVWKPYLIWNTMQKYPNAIVVYADAGCTLNKNYDEWYTWFRMMQSTDTLLTHYRSNVDYGWKEIFGTSSAKISTWTKRLTMDYFDKRFSSIDWHDENKIWGGFIIAKNKSSLIKEVLDIMLSRPDLVIDPKEEELFNQHSEFCQHRHDQSIITPLAYWYKTNNPNIVEIIPESGESNINAAVVASRIRDSRLVPLKTKIIQIIKLILGDKMYNVLHFWK